MNRIIDNGASSILGSILPLATTMCCHYPLCKLSKDNYRLFIKHEIVNIDTTYVYDYHMSDTATELSSIRN